jgi:hypothetical protein
VTNIILTLDEDNRKMTKDEAQLSIMDAISMALKNSTLQQGFEVICKNLSELEKENTELKEKYVQNICDCDICDTYCNSQLIKAKELLRKFLGAKSLEETFVAESETKKFLKEVSE